MPGLLTDAEIRALLKTLKTIAVVGLSPVPARPSYGVTRYMIEAGYEIYGVRPASPPQILGRPAVERLADLKAEIDIINIFRNSEALPALIDEIEDWMSSMPAEMTRPKLLWLQEGVSDEAAESKARKLGLKVIANRCILKEHARLL